MLAGEGPLREAIEARLQSARNPLDVRLLGAITDVSVLLHRSHFLLLLSSSEGLSNALLEALAAGVVPIITDMSGARDVIPFESYPLFSVSGSEVDIAVAVRRAYVHSTQRSGWSGRGGCPSTRRERSILSRSRCATLNSTVPCPSQARLSD
jgi:glycosyltransferase involved in cell wall biosynthesis